MIHIYIFQPFDKILYTGPRTTLVVLNYFYPLGNFLLPVYFPCMSLTKGNPVINLNGQNNTILEDKMTSFEHIFCLTLLCLYKCSRFIYAFLFPMKVKYKEEYEKNKGKPMLEFVETPSYQASKEAQKMQSEVSQLVCY